MSEIITVSTREDWKRVEKELDYLWESKLRRFYAVYLGVRGNSCFTESLIETEAVEIAGSYNDKIKTLFITEGAGHFIYAVKGSNLYKINVDKLDEILGLEWEHSSNE